MLNNIIRYIRSLLAAIIFFGLLLLVFPFVLILVPLSGGNLINPIVQKVGSAIGHATLRTAGIRLNIKAARNAFERPAVFIINHSSTLDMLIIIALGLPRVRFVIKHEFQYNPIFLLIGRLTGQVFIRRQRSEEAILKLKKTQNKILKNRLSILMAPEGSRKHEGVIGPFKKGPFYMARDLEYPIVPIYLEGVRELSQGSSLVTKPGTVNAFIHTPIDTAKWTNENLNEYVEEIRQMYIDWSSKTRPTI